MPKQLSRTLNIQQRAADADGLYSIAISSEDPYERWWGIEILGHSPGMVDLTRLADGRHPLLLNHCTEDQIGVVVSAQVDADRVLRGKVKFSRGTLGQEIQQDVDDGIRSLVSVGYYIEEVEQIEPLDDGMDETIADANAYGNMRYRTIRKLTGPVFEAEMRAKHGDNWTRSGLAAARSSGDKPDTYLVTRWVPFEASIVPVPADVTVGVGRSAGVDTAPQNVQPQLQAPTQPAPEPTAPSPAPSVRIITLERPIMTTKSAAELEIERRDAIIALSEQYAKYLQPTDGPNAARNGLSVDAFKELIMARMEAKHTDVSVGNIGMSQKEVQRYSLGRALLASLTGDWSKAGLERQASQAVAQMMGTTPEGFFVPLDFMRRDFNVGTSTEAGNLVATSLRADLFTDALRANIASSQLGMTFLTGLTGSVDLPRKSTAGTIGMVTEIGSASETAPVTAKATLSPKRTSAFTEVSKQALIQSAIPLEAMIRDDLLTGAAGKLEGQIINGSGSSGEITGLLSVSGIGTVAGGTNGAALAWSHIVDLESNVANSNAEPDQRSGYLTNTKVRGKAKQTQFATNLPFIWQNGAQPLNGYRAAITNHVPSNLTKGTSTTVCSAAMFGSDWSMAVVGLFGAPDVVVDPYTKADTGQVKITLNQFADMQHRQPASLAVIKDLLAN